MQPIGEANTSREPLLGHRYRLVSLLGRGGMGDVYRAHDRLVGQDVALKVVLGEAEEWGDAAATSGSLNSDDQATGLRSTPQDDVATRAEPVRSDLWSLRRRRKKEVLVSERIALANEFRLLASLRHPRIISVLDYGFEVDDPYFTMELVEDPKTLSEEARTLPLRDRLALLVQVLEALTYLHRRGVIHRDLKPSNVLIGSGQAKVCDFGISMESRNQAAARISGTVAYLAPEILTGSPPSEASDLFSVGVVLYELCVGQRPFQATSTPELVRNIIASEPDLVSPDIPRRLAPVLERLLAKDPVDRYAKADIVIGELCAAAELPRPAETSVIRESFLKAARLVGRDKEMAVLENRLDRSLSGSGGAVMLAGESGVGKSRLVDEVKSLAMVRGANVVAGQAVSDSGAAYESWHALFRRLALRPDLTDFEAGVLAPFCPGLDQLIGRSVRPLIALDPRASQDRLGVVLEGLIRRQERPMVLVLEDLHWARSESVALLRGLLPIVSELPVMVLLTSRPDELDESRAHLEGVDNLPIGRLTEDAIQDLAGSVLGESPKLAPFVERMQKESEGNVFFFIEVVRELAETAGRLDAVTEMELPEDLFLGGMRELLRRRLRRLSDRDRELLQVAAVAGRRIDPELLSQVGEVEGIDRWLRRCADAAVIEVRDDRWRFSHDRLRDAATEEISIRERRAIHRELARAIEDLHGRNRDRIAELAYHWSRGVEADRPEVAQLAVDCLESAAEVALENHANEEALELLDGAVALANGDPPPWLLASEAPAAPVEVSKLRRATWMRLRGGAFRNLIRLLESKEALEEGLVLLGRRRAVGSYTVVLSLLGELTRQLFTRVRNRPVPEIRSDADPKLREISRLFGTSSDIYWFRDEKLKLLNATLSALNTSEKAGLSPELPPAYAAFCIVTSYTPLSGAADGYAERALESSQQLGNDEVRTTVLSRLVLYFSSAGRWRDLDHASQEGMELCRRIGNEGIAIDILSMYCFSLTNQGRYDEAMAHWDTAEELAARHRNRLGQCQYGRAAILLKRGQAEEALSYLEEASDYLYKEPTPTQLVMVHGLKSAALTRLGRMPEASESVKEALKAVQAQALNFTILDGYAGLLEALSAGSSKADKGASTDPLKTTRSALEAFADRCPIGRPQSCLWSSLLSDGGRSPRLRLLSRGLTAARELSMPYDEAQLHEAAANLRGGTFAGTHTEQAQEIYDRLGLDREAVTAVGDRK